jgi:GNAT superfamily N-acetyltransferase
MVRGTPGYNLAMGLEVHPFSSERRGDFYRLHSSANEAGWCFCAAWWTPTWEGWGDRSAEDNRRTREALCEAGEYDGYLLYAEDQPCGWCQVGRRDRLHKLRTQFSLEPSRETWAITCFLTAPGFRRRGLASQLLKEVLADLPARGARRVEAFPKRGAGLTSEDLWNGPEEMYLRAGFTVVRDDPLRPVLALDLARSEPQGPGDI